MIADQKKQLWRGSHASLVQQIQWRPSGKKSRAFFVSALLVSLVGCSGGSGGGDNGGGSVSPTIHATTQGYAVKGPLKNATASLYAINLDPDAADLKGNRLTTGSTDNSGQLINLDVPVGVSGPFLLEITNGKELDGSDPVIPVMRTVVRTDQIIGNSKTPVVVSPLTTMATEMARIAAATQNHNAANTVTLQNFYTVDSSGVLNQQAGQLKTMLGFGLLSSVNIFTTPPVIVSADADASEKALNYRTAIEVNAALLKQMATEVGASPASVFDAFVKDISDGFFNGGDPIFTGHTANIVNILAQQPAALMDLVVPGTTPAKKISELNTVMASELGNYSTPAAVTIAGGSVVLTDSDHDGYPDAVDTFPNNAGEYADTDADCGSALNYQPGDYLTSTAGTGCGDSSDVRPSDPNIQNACQIPNNPDAVTASAGTNQTRQIANGSLSREVQLSGSGTSCGGGNATLNYHWSVVSVPTVNGVELLGKKYVNGNTTTVAITKQSLISDSSIATPTFTANFAGNYVFELTVDDGINTSAPVQVTYTITKDYIVDIDGKLMYLSSLAALLLLAIPARKRKQKQQ